MNAQQPKLDLPPELATVLRKDEPSEKDLLDLADQAFRVQPDGSRPSRGPEFLDVPNPALHGRTPRQVMNEGAGGRREVRDVIARGMFGVFE